MTLSVQACMLRATLVVLQNERSISMPKVSEAHKTAVRESLIRAAIDCLEEKGYERTTTRDIMARAGLSAGAFYHYFGSKEELIAASGLGDELL